ncbi:unnamed protein product [Rotaria magnacalcarata]|uniref:Uncharacterized protein n=4 Tax=Rotaria magnacalcarata TaxID=392030 RepID=A0A816MWV7_9BILA|nr:unnamed protein product [Rotaria magnacalcarata]CAF2097729.1 unnamed protein product [Rotaria magnacalcarata]CAF3871419.1 unnamed protein product [Rotaria magnacalcarata]CAF3882263.1 unnamed protein product [Rotaria magnacalcarata]
MPSKPRWTFNARKWFGTLSGSTNKPDRRTNIINSAAPRIFTAATTTTTATATTTTTAAARAAAATTAKITRNVPSASTASRLLTTRDKKKIIPTSTSIDDISSTNVVSSYSHVQLRPYNARRENSSLLPSSKFPNHSNLLLPKRTEPSIPTMGQNDKKLSISTKKLHTERTVIERSKLLPSQAPHRNLSEKFLIDFVKSELNISILSNECIIDYPQSSLNNFIEKHQCLTQAHSSSSIDDHDARDESTSSGIFTDERTDTNDGLGPPSKDTLSTLDVLSVESIEDSQTSLYHYQPHSPAQSYRLPTSISEKTDNQSSSSSLLKRQKLTHRRHRDNSSDSILKDIHTNTPATTKIRQSSAAIIKKIEKRVTANRSPSATLEKAGLVRVANDTYRLAIDKENHLYRRARRNSIIPHTNHDDSLPPANDEESYAAIPRTSSTEQLNDNTQNDLRAIVDDCLRPIVASINKLCDQSTKHQFRSKRSNTTFERPQININEMIDKLLSGIDCSSYAQYQRC